MKALLLVTVPIKKLARIWKAQFGNPSAPTCTEDERLGYSIVTPWLFHFKYSLSFSNPSVQELNSLGSEINPVFGRKGKPSAGALVRADDVPESRLPGLSHPGEAGPEGLVTHFSFQFCHKQEGDRVKIFKESP